MLRKVILHGRLKEQYTDEIELDADDLRILVSGLNSNFSGFEQDFIDGEWHVVRGEFKDDNSDFMKQEEIPLSFGDSREIHIFPKIEGSGGDNGIWSVIIGIGIIAFAWFAAPVISGMTVMGAEAFAIGGLSITWGNIAMFGLSMALGGIAQMLAPTPKIGDALQAERAQDRPSFMFNGPVNVMVQGGPVPLVYGTYEVGSTVVSAGISVERLEVA